jgi:hypothetical protein
MTVKEIVSRDTLKRLTARPISVCVEAGSFSARSMRAMLGESTSQSQSGAKSN